MNLRNRIRLVVVVVRAGGLSAILAAAFSLEQFALAIVAVVLWLIGSGPLLRTTILPAMFPATVCAGCLRTVPLVARWKCGDHFTDHRERHILAFHCNQGHRLEGFNCPRCKATILVQRGERERLRHGSAVRLRTVPRFSSRGLIVGHDGRGQTIHLPWDVLAWHAAVFGGTGRGKSTLLLNLIRQLIELDIGFTLLDCGDLADAARRLVPRGQEGDLLYLDVADIEHPFALNILSAANDIERAVLAEELIELFRRMYGTSWGPLLEHQLRMGLRAAMSARGSLRDVYELFTNSTERSRIVARVHDPAAKSFWVNEFPAIPAIRRAAVVNKLAPIVFHPILGPIICARDCAIDADEAIANHRRVLVSLRSGSPADDVTNVLGTFIVQKVVAAAFRQGALPHTQRARHVLIVDEFPRFIHRAAGFDQILSEARRYQLSLIAASQYVDQLDAATRAAIFGNVGALFAFRVGHKDAGLLAHEFSGSSAEELTDLGVGQCLARLGRDWTRIRTLPPPRLRSRESLRTPRRPPPPAVLPDVSNDNDRDDDEDEEFVQ
jgi:hypothetical protein